MDIRFPIWKPAPGNNGLLQILNSGVKCKTHWLNAICLVTVECGMGQVIPSVLSN